MPLNPSGHPDGSHGPGKQDRLNGGCEGILKGEPHICVYHNQRTLAPIATVGLPLYLWHQCSLHVDTCSTTTHHNKTAYYISPKNPFGDPPILPQMPIP